MTPEQVKQIVQAAIRAERERLANLIRGSVAQFREGTEGGYEFNWDDTVERLAQEIETDDV